ncbi:MAG: hypothetical protein QM500_20875 [Methylococcales bacterium]
MKLFLNFKSKFIQVFGEFLIVVVGVVVALSADTWWNDQKQLSQELAYIEQLLKDSIENRSQIRTAISQEEMQLKAKTNILNHLIAKQELSFDRAQELLLSRRGAFYYSDPRLIDGTLSSLIQSGDIAIINDISLRTNLMSYLNKLVKNYSEFDRWISYELKYISVFDDQTSLIKHTTKQNNIVDLFLLVQKNPKVISAFRGAVRSSIVRLTYLRRMLKDTQQIEKALSSTLENLNTT